MVLIIADRVRESNIITGTGNVTLGGSVAGFRTFASVMTNTQTTWYTLVDNVANTWEVGVGTWNTGNTLSRTTVLASSNSGSLVSFAGNLCDCFVDLPAEAVSGTLAFPAIEIGALNATSIGATTPGTGVFTSQNGGPLAGFRNVVMNGGFDIWQRGASIALPDTGGWSADRWYYNPTGTNTATLEQVTVQGVVAGISYGLGCVVNSGGTGGSGGGSNNVMVHNIEDVRTLAGMQVTLSFYAATSTGVWTMPASLTQNFGTGGSPSSSITTSLGNASLTTTLTHFSFTTTLGSLNGKTLGTTANTSCLSIWLGMPYDLGSSQSIYITGVQLEPGPVATPFEYRPQQVELALCQRFFEIIEFTSGLGCPSTSSGYVMSMYNYSVEKRIVPVMSNINWAMVNCTVVNLYASTVSSIGYYVNSTTAGNVQFYNTTNLWASADL